MKSTSTMTTRKLQLAAAVSFVHVLLLAAGAIDATFIHRDPCKQYEAATLSVLNKVIWPTSRNIAVSGIAPPEFAKDVIGRIVPTGTFETNLGALEYFYRLAGPLELNDTTSNRVDSFQIRWMDCDAKKMQVRPAKSDVPFCLIMEKIVAAKNK